MLDYAAHATIHWTAQRIQSAFDTRCRNRGLEPDEVLLNFVRPESDAEEFWSQVEANLQAMSIRMLFVADLIPPNCSESWNA